MLSLKFQRNGCKSLKKNVILDKEKIQFYSKLGKLNCESKEFYNILLNQIKKKPVCEQRWVEDIDAMILADDDLWSKIYYNCFTLCRDTYTQSLHYRIIHRVIPCNAKLKL